jgi:PAS domain S-box-containing protein
VHRIGLLEESMWEFVKKRFARRLGDRLRRRKSVQTVDGRQEVVAYRLRHSELQFSQLVSGVRDYAVFLLDRQGNVATWNAGAERIKGYQAEDIIGEHFSRFYPKEAVTAGWPDYELSQAAETGRFEDEGWRIRKDGSRFWANVVITAVRGEDGTLEGFLKITRDLTDRKRAEEKLRLSEERFRLMIDGVQDYAIFMLDPEGRVATWNSGAERIKGYKAEEIIGEHFSKFYPEDALQQDWPAEELRRAAAEGRFEDEGWRVRKDGSTFWANVVITALHDETGALRGFSKITQDLTQRREAEENARRLLEAETARKAAEASAQKLQEAREQERRQHSQLEVTLRSIGDAVIVTDTEGRVTFMNPVAVDLTGWPASEGVGQPLEEVFRIVNEYTRKPVENPVTLVLRRGTVVGLANHTILIARDGREIPIDDSGAPVRGEDGTIAGVVLVFRDVTQERKAAEARQLLASIVESSDDAIIGHDLDGTIISWNRGAERLYGYTPEEIIGQPLSLLAPPDHEDEVPHLLEQIRQGRRVEHLETERMCKDGSRVFVSLTVSPIRNAEGEVVGSSKIARDITARREEDRHKTEFLALLAHELRNPLAALRSGLEVQRHSGPDEHAGQQLHEIMERQVQHLVRLVDDLLDVSRISRGALELRPRTLTLKEAVDQALETCRGLLSEQEQELTVRIPEEPLYVHADSTRLAQAICNLLSNASKYSDRGTSILLSVEREADEAVIRVKDAGIGIPAENLNEIFDMFTQADRSLEKAQSGLGVGLAVVKRLIEMHGGSISAHSEGPGRGSEFIIRLPLVAPPDDEPQQQNGEKQHKPSGRRHRILVVDDNQDAASMLARILNLMGHEVVTAHDGEEALETAERFRPDVALLDIGMPKLNGYDACRRMRQQPWGPGMTIVALTGWGQHEDKLRSSEAGFDHHLVKPVAPEALIELLNKRERRDHSTSPPQQPQA